ncbi:MAG: hypothetical protein ABW168_02670, partial [Sedimenticola sp.]
QQEIPSRATFSRAFTEFAETQLAERVHSALIETHLGDQLIGHISRDSTAIGAREKPEKRWWKSNLRKSGDTRKWARNASRNTLGWKDKTRA